MIAAVSDARVASVLRLAQRFDPRGVALMRERRLAVPGLIDALGAALASGLSIQMALAEIAPTLPKSLARATERASAALTLGASVDDALGAYTGVIPGEDLAPLAIVLGAFARSGGRIARSLGRVAALLRGRVALGEERDALTAQGRATAVVLIALAPLSAVFFAVLTPDYFEILIGRGGWMAAVAVALEIAGALWLSRILRVATPGTDFASLLDAVIVGLDAGLTFELALASLVARAPKVGRLPEARRLLADLALGRGSKDALATFGAAGATEARVAALVGVATRFGTPLSELLVTQADTLRMSDRRRAEAQARRMPILMLFPLAFCILPALLIVFLGPALLALLR